ncbi:hypothetical protein GGI15_003329 [Coemansia interrupta]|uniref:Uncharacterized protein n=1 Tax=Coemansia interrupta TaxID=1126814 RepID=A0A9W8LHU6_9FUNG|nr:hypothetical protein GGI15_003329 [Coemansia interrupta]
MASSSTTPRTSVSPERLRHTPPTTLLTPSASASHAMTPVRARPQALQTTSLSAPARSRILPFSPLPTRQATQRSRQSLEAILVARTLKEGFARLKALAEPHAGPTRPSTRPLRTLSATLAMQGRRRPPFVLARHHSAMGTAGGRGFAEGGVEEAAEAMLFMRTQAARAQELPDDPPPLPPPLGAQEPALGTRHSPSASRERDACETEDEAVLLQRKRKCTDTGDIPARPLSLPRVADLLSQPPSSGRASPAYDHHNR